MRRLTDALMRAVSPPMTDSKPLMLRQIRRYRVRIDSSTVHCAANCETPGIRPKSICETPGIRPPSPRTHMRPQPEAVRRP
jgi:hypothetical protein